jgi:hypothetical protein
MSGSSAYLPAEFGVVTIFKAGWEVVKENWPQLLIFVVVYFLASQIPAWVGIKLFRESSMWWVFQILLNLWSLFLSLGAVKYGLALVRGKKPDVMMLFNNKDQFVEYLIMNIRLGLVLFFGFCLLIIPGIYFSFKYAYVPFLVADGKATGSEAFRLSGKMTKGRKWTMLRYGILGWLLSMLGLLLFVLPGLVAIGVTYMGGLLMYEYLLIHTSKKGSAVEAEVVAAE